MSLQKVILKQKGYRYLLKQKLKASPKNGDTANVKTSDGSDISVDKVVVIDWQKN